MKVKKIVQCSMPEWRYATKLLNAMAIPIFRFKRLAWRRGRRWIDGMLARTQSMLPSASLAERPGQAIVGVPKLS